ncbi:tryptase-like [Arapaima gigas]
MVAASGSRRLIDWNSVHMAGFNLLSLTLLLVTVAVLNQVGTGSSIIGGKDVEGNNFYWMAAVVRRLDPYVIVCGGSVIASRWVMTAAHCFTRSSNEYEVRLAVRSLIKSSSSQDIYSIVRIRKHPHYTNKYNGNDIALVKLNRDVVTHNYASPYTKLATFNQKFTISDSCQVAGWGRVKEFGEFRLNGFLPVFFGMVFTLKFSQRCVNKCVYVTCLSQQGDSGGSLLCYSKDYKDWFLVGIVSFGRRCGQTGYPSVYTRVASYNLFIKNTIHNY